MKLSIGILTLLFVGVAAAQQPAIPPIPDSDASIVQLLSFAPDANTVLGGQLLASGPATAHAMPARTLTERQWKVFSTNIEKALGSDYEGMQTTAMRLIIQYGDNVRVGDEAVFNLMRLYRDHDDVRVRRMAVVTMGEIGSRRAIGYLERAAHFEKSPTVRQTIDAVVADYHRNRIAS